MAKRSRVSGRPGQRRRPGRSGPRPAARPGAAPNVLGGQATPNILGTPEVSDKPIAAPSGLTDAEIARAAELEAQLVAQEQTAASSPGARRSSTSGSAGLATFASTSTVTPARRYGTVDPALASQPLSVRASHEYAYVARDVKRIALTGGLMVVILIVLDVLINVTGAIKA
jgi:hypothetical protein